MRYEAGGLPGCFWMSLIVQSIGSAVIRSSFPHMTLERGASSCDGSLRNRLSEGARGRGDHRDCSRSAPPGLLAGTPRIRQARLSFLIQFRGAEHRLSPSNVTRREHSPAFPPMTTWGSSPKLQDSPRRYAQLPGSAGWNSKQIARTSLIEICQRVESQTWAYLSLESKRKGFGTPNPI